MEKIEERIKELENKLNRRFTWPGTRSDRTFTKSKPDAFIYMSHNLLILIMETEHKDYCNYIINVCEGINLHYDIHVCVVGLSKVQYYRVKDKCILTPIDEKEIKDIFGLKKTEMDTKTKTETDTETGFRIPLLSSTEPIEILELAFQSIENPYFENLYKMSNETKIDNEHFINLLSEKLKVDKNRIIYYYPTNLYNLFKYIYKDAMTYKTHEEDYIFYTIKQNILSQLKHELYGSNTKVTQIIIPYLTDTIEHFKFMNLKGILYTYLNDKSLNIECAVWSKYLKRVEIKEDTDLTSTTFIKICRTTGKVSIIINQNRGKISGCVCYKFINKGKININDTINIINLQLSNMGYDFKNLIVPNILENTALYMAFGDDDEYEDE